MQILNVTGLKKVYTTRFGGSQVTALRQVDFSVEEGNMWPLWASPAPARPPC